MIDGVQIPFPESVKDHSLGGSEYFPDLTLDSLQSYAEATTSMKAFKEGRIFNILVMFNLFFFHRITETIKFCFIKALVVPQTRIAASPYSVWVCLRNDISSILTVECTCLAGSSYSCKYVFALLHCIENDVHIGRNKSFTEKKQQWDVRV